jgi:hypothetical protein
MLELLRGDIYIYLQSPCLPLAVVSLHKSNRLRRASTPSLEECADTFSDDSIKVIHHDELHDLIGVGSPSLPR